MQAVRDDAQSPLKLFRMSVAPVTTKMRVAEIREIIGRGGERRGSGAR